MAGSAWTLRPATEQDRDFLFELNRAAMGAYVDSIWGWDEEEQVAYFDAHFDPSTRKIVQVEGMDVGVLSVDESPAEIYLAGIAFLPEWQGRGIGSSIIRSLLDRGAESGRAVTLQVLHSNPRAARLYESLRFVRTGRSATHVFMRAEPHVGRRDPRRV